jgi:hypothetical protein
MDPIQPMLNHFNNAPAIGGPAPAFGGPAGAFGGPAGAFGGPVNAFGGPLNALKPKAFAPINPYTGKP